MFLQSIAEIKDINREISMVKEIGMIAHSCGVEEPRALQRMHCRLVTATGRSMPLDELFPAPAPRTDRAA